MVLFKDEEEQIKQQERALKPRRKLPVVLKVLFVLCLLICGGLFAVSKQEGNSDTLKSSLEGYLSSATGMTTEIGTLNNIAFFPNVKLDAENIFMSKGDGTQRIRIDKIDFKAPFIAISMSRLRFHRLDIQGVASSAGLITQEPLSIDHFSIVDPEGKFPQITTKGKLGDKSFGAFLELAKTEKSHGRKIFHSAANGKFDIQFEDIHISGNRNREDKKIYWKLDGETYLDSNPDEDLSAPTDDEPKMAGTQPGQGSEKTEILAHGVFSSLSLNRINGSVETGKTKILLDLFIDEKQGTTGRISSPSLHLADIPLFVGINNFVESQLPASEDFPLSSAPIKVDMSADQIIFNSHMLGHISTPLIRENSDMTIGPIRGELGGGKVSGTYEVKSAELPATMSLQTLLTGFNYAQYQSSISDPDNKDATLTLSIELDGKGQNFAEIYNTLNGHIHLVAGKGHMRSTAFDIWTGGLLGALFPSGSEENETTLNCALAYFEIQDGIGKPAPFFIDTDQATIIGDGDINFGSQTIDLTITPELKDAAILDVSTPISIDGDLFAPSIGPSATGLGKVLGTVLLGVLNPATLLVTMNDLGLSETHPCREFAGQNSSE